MELSVAIIEVLKEFSSETKTAQTGPMSLADIQRRLVMKFGDTDKTSEEITEKDWPTRKMVRTSMADLLVMEELLPNEQRTIRFSESETKEGIVRRTNYYYANAITDAELKFLLDSTLYSSIINQKHANRLAKNIQNLSGKHLKDMTQYAAVFGETRYSPSNDVLSNVELLMQALGKSKVTFQLNVYSTGKRLVPAKKEHDTVNPHYVVMGSGRYYLLATYDNSEKVYYFRVDLMTDIRITKEPSVGREKIPELKNGIDWSKYMFQHPYMVTGTVERIKLRIKKEHFTQIIDWFGTDIRVLSETGDTVDVEVRACEKAMKYWLLSYGESVEALNMTPGFAEEMREAAKIIYEKYGKGK